MTVPLGCSIRKIPGSSHRLSYTCLISKVAQEVSEKSDKLYEVAINISTFGKIKFSKLSSFNLIILDFRHNYRQYILFRRALNEGIASYTDPMSKLHLRVQNLPLGALPECTSK